jgi:hypothetical protein
MLNSCYDSLHVTMFIYVWKDTKGIEYVQCLINSNLKHTSYEICWWGDDFLDLKSEKTRSEISPSHFREKKNSNPKYNSFHLHM